MWDLRRFPRVLDGDSQRRCLAKGNRGIKTVFPAGGLTSGYSGFDVPESLLMTLRAGLPFRRVRFLSKTATEKAAGQRKPVDSRRKTAYNESVSTRHGGVKVSTGIVRYGKRVAAPTRYKSGKPESKRQQFCCPGGLIRLPVLPRNTAAGCGASMSGERERRGATLPVTA